MSDELPAPGDLVRALGQRARKSFGQHFLSDPSVLDRIVALAQLSEGDRVVEIGPGPGGLSVRLLATGARVDCIDADADMVEHLEQHLGAHPRFSVRQGDATSDALDEVLGTPAPTVVSNLPYNAATPILFRLIEREQAPARMVLMFQLEVAERVVCAGSARHFGPLGLACNLLYRTRLAFTLKPGAFTPPPKVRSGVVLFELRDDPPGSPEDRDAARKLARAAFGQRRKMLRKSLSGVVVDPVGLAESAGIAPTARPESLSLEDFVRLGAAFRSLHPSE